MRHAALFLVALLSHCVPAREEPLVLTETRYVSRMQATGGHVAFVEGVEASSDPAESGISVRVVDLDGADVWHADVDGAVRGLALTEDAVATLELSSTLADQHLVIRPLAGGDPVLVPHRFPPIALGARAGRLFFVEARVTGFLDADGDGTAEANEIALELVQVDTDGLVRRRTEVALPGGIRGPASALSPFPRVFGLVATEDVAHLGWGSLLCGGSSEVLAIDLGTGATTVAWRGRAAVFEGDSCACASVPDNVTELGETLLLVDGALVVAGSVYSCASLSPEEGFLLREGSTMRLADPILAGVSGPDGALLASRGALFELGDELLPVPSPPHDPVSALAWDEGAARRALVGASRAIYRLDL